MAGGNVRIEKSSAEAFEKPDGARRAATASHAAGGGRRRRAEMLMLTPGAAQVGAGESVQRHGPRDIAVVWRPNGGENSGNSRAPCPAWRRRGANDDACVYRALSFCSWREMA